MALGPGQVWFIQHLCYTKDTTITTTSWRIVMIIAILAALAAAFLVVTGISAADTRDDHSLPAAAGSK